MSVVGAIHVQCTVYMIIKFTDYLVYIKITYVMIATENLEEAK